MEKGLGFFSGISCVLGIFKIVNGITMLFFNVALAAAISRPELLESYPLSGEDMSLLKDMGLISHMPFMNIFTLLMGGAFLVIGIIGLVKRQRIRRAMAEGDTEGIGNSFYKMMIVFLIIFSFLIIISGVEIFLIGW